MRDWIGGINSIFKQFDGKAVQRAVQPDHALRISQCFLPPGGVQAQRDEFHIGRVKVGNLDEPAHGRKCVLAERATYGADGVPVCRVRSTVFVIVCAMCVLALWCSADWSADCSANCRVVSSLLNCVYEGADESTSSRECRIAIKTPVLRFGRLPKG